MTPAPDTGRTAEDLLDDLDRANTVTEPQRCADLMDEARLAIIALRAENANLRDRVREAEKGAEAMRGDPGRAAYEARFAHARPRDVEPWDSLPPEVKAIWARVEAACRAPASLSAQEG